MEFKSKTEHLSCCFSGFAVIHIIMGFITTAFSLSGLGLDVTTIDQLIEEKGENVTYILLGLDTATIVGSISFVVAGLATCCMTCCGGSLVKTKVTTMVCSILAASVFSPVMIGAAVTGYILRGKEELKFVIVPGMLAGLAVLELFLSVITAIVCCKTAWHVKTHKHDKAITNDTDQISVKDQVIDELKQKEKMVRKEEKRQRKALKKEEKAEQNLKKENKEEKSNPKKLKVALTDDCNLSEIVLAETSEKVEFPPPYKF